MFVCLFCFILFYFIYFFAGGGGGLEVCVFEGYCCFCFCLSLCLCFLTPHNTYNYFNNLTWENPFFHLLQNKSQQILDALFSTRLIIHFYSFYLTPTSTLKAPLKEMYT